ncbi:ABC transporter permease [Inquilinus limosus]|uniref:ABC transporter permease n=1 Tax=Inquilinus limosus TaxID=171674 RepID=UPI001B7F84BE|nr:ABC transporter permease [Inquilinus limosus]
MMDRTVAPPASPTAGRRGRTWIEPALDHIVWLILLVVLAVFSLTIPDFFQTGIFLNILEQSTFVGILAVGLSLVIIAGQMDLSIESVLALSAMVTALFFGTSGAGLAWTMDPPWLALPVTLIGAVLLGCVVGLVNATLVVRFRINAFIVTLAAYIALRGTVVASSSGRSVYGLPAELRAVAIGTFLDIPVLAWILIAVFLVFGFILTRTPFGRHLYMIGGNPQAPFRAGIKVDRLVTIAFMLSGALAAFAGWLLAARTAGATANLGIGMLFETFAAVVIGGVSLKGGAGRLSGVFAGVLLLSAIRTAINVMGMPPHYTQVIQGTLVLAAVLLDTLKTSIRKRYL